VAFAVGRLYPVTTALLVLAPVSAHAQAAPDPQDNKPIVPDAEFDKALPPLSNDINARPRRPRNPPRSIPRSTSRSRRSPRSRAPRSKPRRT